MRRTVAVTHPIAGTIAQTVYLATDPWHRFVGLMGSRELPAGTGMLFNHTNAIHGFFMRYALQVIFMDVDHTILKIAVLEPWHLAMAPRAYWVLELAPTTPLPLLAVGDQLSWAPGGDGSG